MAVENVGNSVSYVYIPQHCDKNSNRENQKYSQYENGECKQLLGSAQTQVAKKGIKYFWKEFKSFIKRIVSGDKDAHQQVVDIYNVYDNTHKTIDIINDINDIYNTDNNNYNYVA